MSRPDDENMERKAAQFLDRNFWTRLGRPFERCSDRRRQLAGCDLRLGKAYFDEKCKYSKCVNRPLTVLSFEVQFVNRAGNAQPGWFVAPGLSTDYYAFVNVSCDAGGDLSAAYVTFVSRREAGELAGGIDLLAEADRLRDEGDAGDSADGKFRRRWADREIWLTYSSGLPERPVNMVAPRDVLDRLKSTRSFLVTEGKIQKG